MALFFDLDLMTTHAAQMLLMVEVPRGQVLPNYDTHEALIRARLAELVAEAHGDGEVPANLFDDLLGVEARGCSDPELVELLLMQPGYRRVLEDLRTGWDTREALSATNAVRPTGASEATPEAAWQTLESADPEHITIMSSRLVAVQNPDEDEETRDLREQAELWYKEMTLRAILEQVAALN